MTALRPAPADLAVYASAESMDQLRRRYRASKATICTWMASEGIVRQPHRGGNAPKVMPADFPEHFREPLRLLQIRYPGIGDGTLTRWRRALGGIEMVPPPADFAERWVRMSNAALCGHYRRGWKTITRWAADLGLTRPDKIVLRKPSTSAPPRAKAATLSFARSAPERAPLRPERANAFQAAIRHRGSKDMSSAGQAADYLRRFGPVVRCDERGRYHENGTHWRRNTTVLTAAEIIERAELNGWDSQAWAKVA